MKQSMQDPQQRSCVCDERVRVTEDVDTRMSFTHSAAL